MAGGTTHHCPKKSKGACGPRMKTPSFKKPYCGAHQTYCKNKECGERVHLQSEDCVKCVGRKQAEERKKRGEEKEKKAKEEAEKKAAQLAQSIKDRTFKGKHEKKV